MYTDSAVQYFDLKPVGTETIGVFQGILSCDTCKSSVGFCKLASVLEVPTSLCTLWNLQLFWFVVVGVFIWLVFGFVLVWILFFCSSIFLNTIQGWIWFPVIFTIHAASCYEFFVSGRLGGKRKGSVYLLLRFQFTEYSINMYRSTLFCSWLDEIVQWLLMTKGVLSKCSVKNIPAFLNMF